MSRPDGRRATTCAARRGAVPGSILGAALAALVALGAGCSSGSPGHPTSVASTTGSSPASSAPASTGAGPGRSTATTSAGATGSAATSASGGPAAVGPTKLLVVVMENHSLAQMRAQMPYTESLAQRYGYATAWSAVRHPSLPNYLAIASGSTHGVTDDAAPAQHPLPGATVFGRALAAGSTAAVYAEGMARPCQQEPEGRYAVKHNPWAYFPAERAACERHDLPLDALQEAVAAGTLPAAGMVVPDLCHDAHDCGLGVADDWFRTWMTRIQTGPDWRSGRLVVVLTADEDDHSSGNRVLTVVAHPSLHHVVVTAPLDHYSLTRLYAEVTRTAPLGRAAGATSVAAAFGLPLPR
ncbi:alkaline phosphatase family protein [Phycicoccus sp. M110.8]|uniref:alkaline phosphatase family protein n=1 Tax=Phycicoccus sp. M110.8 TaxID=3075433 RepID=UPI0028FD5A60|nr:alkaline phosphatase family protein [Phycicoccus sp. M110.8]MDU0315138.1 alkaline phosphatase family protein [Phycicoccus sp. M110.8]